MLKNLLFVFSLLSLLFINLPLSSFAEEMISSSQRMKLTSPINISADEIEHTGKENIIMGKGNVEIIYEKSRVNAQKISIDIETGEGSAQGEVIFTYSKNLVTCEKAQFNLKTGKGLIYKGKGYTDTDFFFEAENMERKEFDQYIINEGLITACGEENPFWKIKVKKAKIRLKKYAVLKEPTFYIKDFPVFYLPYLIVPVDTKRASGFLFPDFGWGSKDGTMISNHFFWAINGQSDSTLALDYLSKRGIRQGLEYRYFSEKETRGEFKSSYLKEKNSNQEFYKVDFNHRQKFPPGSSLLAKLDIVSENNPEHEFADEINERTRTKTDSYFALTKNWNYQSLQLISRYNKSTENNITAEFGKLPALIFKQQPQSVGNSPFIFKAESSYSSFLLKEDCPASESCTKRVDRIQFNPAISMSLLNSPYLTIVPEAGISEFYYSRGTASAPNEGFWRNLYTANLFFSGPELGRKYFSNYKHLIEPDLTYAYQAPLGKDHPENIISLDNLEQTGFYQKITPALVNKIFKKEDTTIREIFRLTVSDNYYLAPINNYSELNLALKSNLIKSFEFNLDSNFNPDDKKIKSLNMETGWKQDGLWSINLYRRLAWNETMPGSLELLPAKLPALSQRYIGSELEIIPYRNLSLKYLTRFNEEQKEFLENNYSLNYFPYCWGFSVKFIQRKFLFENLLKDETKFYFTLSFKGLGTIGGK